MGDTATIWTLDGDENSWTAWANQMSLAPISPLMQTVITPYKTEQKNWAIDIGCGTGRAFLPLVKAGYQVIGIDPNPEAVRLSQARARRVRLPAIPILASAACIPISSSSIAFVIAISSLFHLSYTELTSALQEIRRVLLPGGKAVLHFLDLEDWRRTLGKPIQPAQAPVPSYQAVVTCFCSQEQIRDWISQAGLSLVALALQTNLTEAGQQRNWLAHCTR